MVAVYVVFVLAELLYVLVVHPEQLLYWRNLQQLDNLISSLFKYFSLAIDESNDTTDTAQLLILIRGIDAKFRITEKLCSLRSLKRTTTAENIFSEVITALSSLGLLWKNLKSITTDGARNMVGKKKGVSALINEKLEANGGS